MGWSFAAVRVGIGRPPPNVLALLLLPLLCAVGLVGNALVCVAIATDRRLQNITNYFLFSLAFADLLVCCIVMPVSIIVEVKHGQWTWSFPLCLLYVYSDVLLCSASIVHMSVISLDRYLGISQPLKTRNKSRSAIIIKIVVVWLITFLISSPIAVIAINDPAAVLSNSTCAISNRYYMVYGSTLSFLIPFLIMAVTYVRTTHLLNKQASVLSQKANDRFGNGLRRTMPHRKLGYVRTNSSTTNGTNTTSTTRASVRGGMSAKASTVSHGNSTATNSGKLSLLSANSSPNGHYVTATAVVITSSNNNDREREKKDELSALIHSPLTAKQSTVERWRSRTSSYLSSLANRVSRKTSLQAASAELANEHKATRVLAVVFVCFFICWTPFFAANFLYGFCGEECAAPSWLSSCFLWLGYISSTINPLIYTVFNKRFRLAFVRILRCQCFHSVRDRTVYSRHTTIIPEHTWSNVERTVSQARDDWRSKPTVSRVPTEESDEDAEQKPLLADRKSQSAAAATSHSTLPPIPSPRRVSSPSITDTSSTSPPTLFVKARPVKETFL